MTDSKNNKKFITRQDRETQNGHQASVIWLTGVPAAGKSTIAVNLEQSLFQRGIKTFVLDGDIMREGLSSDLGFADEDRFENIRRVGHVAKLFYEAGCVVIGAFISPFEEMRRNIRNALPAGAFIEVFVDCPLEECMRRDPKGLYAKAKKGQTAALTGYNAPYERPLKPEIHLETNHHTVDECVVFILDFLIKKRILDDISLRVFEESEGQKQ
jgi:adenylylsulfate kinase